jgi:hypothetical protein
MRGFVCSGTLDAIAQGKSWEREVAEGGRFSFAANVSSPSSKSARPCAPFIRPPSKSTTQTTRHANSPATTKRPWPRASPRPAREAGATDPEQLGEQLALLLDGASARNRVLNVETFDTAAAIATVLIGAAIPTAASR